MMKAKTILQELARQVRQGTLQILEAAPDRCLTFAPPGTSNHILWHAGHAIWLQDVLCIELVTGRSELPPDWSETFGMNCRPLQETKTWPSRQEMSAGLRQQLQRISEVLEEAPIEQLAQTANPSRGPASVADRIIHGLHDEAKHSGEMYLLLKQSQS